jgi:hypothetical protein
LLVILLIKTFVGTGNIFFASKRAFSARRLVIWLICIIALPAANRETQYLIPPLPLPIRIPNGLAVTGMSGTQRNHIFCFSFFFLVVIILLRVCSSCLAVRWPLFKTRNPTVPCSNCPADILYWHFFTTPLCNLLNFVRLGCQVISIVG